jgi:hypothetical protein
MPEPAQKAELLLSEPHNVDQRLCSAQHREQTQQQHLGKRVNYLAALTWVGQILE